MKRFLHLLLFILFTLTLQAQKDSMNYTGALIQHDIIRSNAAANVNIYPVPVRDNSFTIRTDRDISYVRITNIIGQDIYRSRYSNSEQQIRIYLDNPRRGMYLVTINFSDGSRVVKKILVEEAE